MLKKNEKFIRKLVDEAKDSFDQMIEEMQTIANETMKQILSKKGLIGT